MEPESENTLLNLLTTTILNHARAGAIRSRDVSEEVIRDNPELWSVVRDGLARERFHSVTTVAISQLSKTVDHAQLGFSFAGFERVPVLLSGRKGEWKPILKAQLPELKQLVKELVERFERTLAAKPASAERKAALKGQIREQKKQLAEARELVRLVTYWTRTEPEITVEGALARRDEF